jgi:hypothetical protein
MREPDVGSLPTPLNCALVLGAAARGGIPDTPSCGRLSSLQIVNGFHKSSRSPLNTGCRTLSSGDFARYSISTSSSGSTQTARWAVRLL